jgi:hypothetical protein
MHTAVDALQSQLSEIVSEAWNRSHNEDLSACGTCFSRIFVNPNEVPKRDRKLDFIIGVKGVEAQMILKTSYDYGKAQRIEARLEKGQIVRQSSQFLGMLRRNAYACGGDQFPYLHDKTLA